MREAVRRLHVLSETYTDVTLQDRFKLISQRMLVDFAEAGLGRNPGVKGGNREEKLAAFLSEKLPLQYAITSGEIAFRDGTLSNQADIIVYDRLRCPVLYSATSSIIPIDGTYGIIEVKSHLSKDELRDAALKVATFKEKAPRDLAVIRKTEHVTLARPGRPFGVVFGYRLKGNSLDSLVQNWMAINREVGIVNNWINMIAVLGEGLIILGRRKSETAVEPFLETDALVNYTFAAKEGKNDGNVHALPLAYSDDTLMFFFFYSSAMLARTQVVPVDIGRYVDPNLPPIVHSIL